MCAFECGSDSKKNLESISKFYSKNSKFEEYKNI